MGFAAVQRIVGFLIAASSLMMLPPVLVSLWYRDGTVPLFLACAAILLTLGVAIWFPVRRVHRELRIRHGFLIVVCAWLAWVLVGALPFVLLSTPELSYVDAVFESMSGLTTTGATIVTNIDALPRAVLYYRQQLQWLGGMGIIVLAVAVLPMLGIGGMQLYRAETPGPMKDNKLTPRITEAAKALWYIYLGLTVACGLAYWVAGMSAFDAIGHAFSTVAIGGFSTHDASIGYFNSPVIDLVAVVFMFLAGINFSLHFVAFRHRSVFGYWQDSEFRFYVFLLTLVITITVLGLYLTETYDTWQEALINGLFQAVSIGTTAGFTTAEFYNWPGFIAILLLFSSFVGGCAGSTACSVKIFRYQLLSDPEEAERRRSVAPDRTSEKPEEIPGFDQFVDFMRDDLEALGLLKDKNGLIALTVPVEGDLADLSVGIGDALRKVWAKGLQVAMTHAATTFFAPLLPGLPRRAFGRAGRPFCSGSAAMRGSGS